jgi:hypothetical protein
MIGSFGALFNGACKIILASSLDYLPFKPVYCGILIAIISSLILVHFVTTSAVGFGACIWVNFMGDGSMTSMLPVVTLNVFGLKRGTQVYGYMYSVFGLAAMSGTVIVDTLQHRIDYSGMLVVCLMFTSTAAIFTYFYRFDVPLSYAELMDYVRKG